MKKLNKTIARFWYKKKYYELDWLTDADGGGFREYDIFQGRGKKADLVGHISSKICAPSFLIREAKRELLLTPSPQIG